MPTPGVAARSTLSASAVTSGPIPSPPTTASLMVREVMPEPYWQGRTGGGGGRRGRGAGGGGGAARWRGGGRAGRARAAAVAPPVQGELDRLSEAGGNVAVARRGA